MNTILKGNNNKRPRVCTLEVASHIKRLLATARNSRDNYNQDAWLLSALIYASVAEYFGILILSMVELDLTFYLARNLPQIGLTVRKHKRTNLEYLVNELSRYRFHNHEEIIELLITIRDARNMLFHNLMTAPQKGINIKKQSEIISQSTEELMKLQWQHSNSPYENQIWSEDDE